MADLISPYEIRTLFPLVEKGIAYTQKNFPLNSKLTFETRKTTFEVVENVSNVILAFGER